MGGRRLFRLAAGLALAIVVAVSPVAGGLAAAPAYAPLPSEDLYPDVPLTLALAEPVAFLARQGIMSGFPDGTFQPASPLTRAQLATIAAKAADLAPAAGPTGFADAATIPAWAKPYVAAAVAAKLLKGYPDRTFRAGATATEAEVLAVLLRALGDARGSGWPEGYVAAAARADLAGGRTPPAVVPERPAIRAWTAEVVDNALHGTAVFTAGAAGRPAASGEGGIWARNLWNGTLPASVAGIVTSMSAAEIAVRVRTRLYPAGGAVPVTATYALDPDVLLAGGYQSRSAVHVGDRVTLGVDRSGKVDFIEGSPPAAAAPACPPTFTSPEVAAGVTSFPVRLSGPNGSVAVLALAGTLAPFSMVDRALLQRLGYRPGSAAFRAPYLRGAVLTGALYAIDAPEVWVDDHWYPIRQAGIGVAGIDNLGRFGGWQVVLGSDLLQSFKTIQQDGLWTVTPPCAGN